MFDALRTTYIYLAMRKIVLAPRGISLVRTYLGAIDEVVSGKVYFAKRTLANEFPDSVIPDVFEFFGRKLSAWPVN